MYVCSRNIVMGRSILSCLIICKYQRDVRRVSSLPWDHAVTLGLDPAYACLCLRLRPRPRLGATKAHSHDCQRYMIDESPGIEDRVRGTGAGGGEE